MPTLTVSRAGWNKHLVVLTADDGAVVEAYSADLMSPRPQKRLADATGLSPARVAEIALATTPKGSDPVTVAYAAPAAAGEPPAGPFAVVVRGIAQPLDTGTIVERPNPAAALLAAFDLDYHPAAEPVVQWDGLDRLCCLDVDYHALPLASRPSVEWLTARACQIHPRPVALHASHGRGAKLYYAERPGFTARELAAVGAVAWRNLDARATCDLVRISRHPKYPRPGYPACGPVVPQTPGDDLAPVAAWLQRSADPLAVDDWLDARGWRRGQTLPHDECPIDPTDTAHGEPVFVGDDGVFCHRCAAKGVGLGRRPGFAPWPSLVGGAPPRAAVMLRNAVHWAHARLILRADTRLPDGVLEPAYRAALKMTHGPDSDAARAAAHAGADIIRMPGRWVSPAGDVTYAQNLHGMVNALPAVWVPGTREVAADRRDLFLQPGDLSHYGYYPVSPVHGAAVWGRHLPYPDGRVAFATPAAWCRDRNPPRYAPPAARMPLADAWAMVERPFPGINRAYVELLVALKGLAEGGTAQAPFVIVTGPTASAKSSTVHVAASICGDTATEPTFAVGDERLLQAVAEGLDKGSFVVLNEVFKCASRAKLKPRAALDPVLNLTPSTVSHRLYIGPRPLGRLPALVLTDVEIPDSVKADAQLGRRLVLVEQTSRVEWNETIAQAGFGEVGRFRLWSPDAAAACDAILSDVTDRFFREPLSVKEIAGALGFKTLEDSGYAIDGRGVLARLFWEVLAAPNLSGADLQRYPAPGWKAVGRGDTSPLADLWGEVADDSQGEGWRTSRQATAEDWQKLLGAAEPVFLDVSHYRGKLYLRFRQGGRWAPTWVSANGASPPAGVSPPATC